MKTLLILFTLIFMVGCSSTIGIPANQSFVLGEYENRSFKASLKNLSNTDLQLLIVDTKSRKEINSLILVSKGMAKITVSKDQTAIIQNSTNEDVEVKANLSKTVRGMGYEELRKE